MEKVGKLNSLCYNRKMLGHTTDKVMFCDADEYIFLHNEISPRSTEWATKK
jgi:hypothetical protein